MGRPFVLEGTVAFISRPFNHQFVLRTGSDDVILTQEESVWKTTSLQRGDRVRVFGKIGHRLHPPARIVPRVYRTDVLGKEEPPPPLQIDLADIPSIDRTRCFISTRGRVRDSFRDEIDPGYHFLILQSGSTCLPVSYAVKPNEPDDDAFIGAIVSVTGVLTTNPGGLRKILGQHLSLADTHDISILKPAPKDIFDVPFLLGESDLTPNDALGMTRRKVAGRVIATWDANVLIKNDTDGRLTNVEVLRQEEMPVCDSVIEATGIPETDLYRLNLTHAVWRPCPGKSFAATPPLTSQSSTC